MRLVLSPSTSQLDDLDQFLERQRDPASPDYRNWLTPEQFGERFGMSQHDLAAIGDWLQSQGFAIEQVARARNWITFNGTAGQISRAFHTELHFVENDGEMHFANISDPWIPVSLAGIVAAVRGLDDFHPKPQRVKSVWTPQFNSSTGANYLGPDDFAAIYDVKALYGQGFDGTGQQLAIAGQTDVNLSDIRAFRAEFNLAAKDPQLVLFGGDPGANQNDQIEANLDLEWSGAVARNATIIYVYSQDVFESLQYAIDQNLAPVVSVSYGGCELQTAPSFRTLAQQANAQGITWVNASGDTGAAGCDSGKVASHGASVTFPANIPEVTAVGGTEFNEAGGTYWSTQNGATLASALSYIPEKAWNDTSLGAGMESGGGGASLIFSKPWWQTGPGVPADNARDVPDVSLAASAEHDGYVMFARGSLMVVGGTSAASPAFAGIVSILSQYLVAKGSVSKPGLGNINPALYNLAQTTTGLFHDIVAGNNIVPCAAGTPSCVNGSFGYPAGPGYDLATGLGSVDAFNLVTKWAGVPVPTGFTMTLSASPSVIPASASMQLIAKVTAVSGVTTPAGTVAFATGGAALGSAALSGSGPAATATLTVKGSSLVTGANAIVASFNSSTASAVVSVTATATNTSTTVTASPATIPQTNSTVLTATVKPASGSNVPTGTVTFVAGKVTLGVASLAGAVASLTVKGASLVAGANTIVASYAASGNFTNSTGSVTVTISMPPVGTATTATVTPASIPESGTTQITATVKPLAGNSIPAGTVTFAAGTRILGTTTLSNSGGIATLSVPGNSLAPGSNSIIATYGGDSGFAGSASTPVTVSVTAAPVATVTSVTATPAGVAPGSLTVLTATVKAASGSGGPTGKASFSLGATLLGSGTVTVSGSTLTAILAVKRSILATGENTITATYTPTGNFTSSSSSTTVVVTGAQLPPQRR